MEILDRFAKYVHWVVFLLLELLSGFMLFQFNHYQKSVWVTQANTVAGKVLEVEGDMRSYIHLKRENEALTFANLALQRELDSLRHALAEEKHDSSYTERKLADLLSTKQLIPAKVVANSVRLADNYLTLNVGSNDGVRPEMGVVSGTGIVGIVSRVTPHYSLVLSVLNRRSSVSCRLRGTEYYGYLKWSGRSPLRAYIDDIPRHAKFKVGDAVETSGFSNVFPEGIFIGRVAQIHDSADGMAYQLEVLLSTDLACLRNVCVVVNEYRDEIDSLNVRGR